MKKERLEEVKKETATEQKEKIKETEEISVKFFQEDVLSFLPETMREVLKKELEKQFKVLGKSEIFYCVFLKNVTALSSRTYQLFVQTDEPEHNLYQVLINANAEMIDIEKYQGEIADIEAYGGAEYGDMITRIYVYGLEKDAGKETDTVTLEEEMEAKEKEYQEEVKRQEEQGENESGESGNE